MKIKIKTYNKRKISPQEEVSYHIYVNTFHIILTNLIQIRGGWTATRKASWVTSVTWHCYTMLDYEHKYLNIRYYILPYVILF